MFLLITDYLRRYWWGFLILLFAPLGYFVEEISYFAFVALLGPCLLLLQERNGAARVWQCLPVTQRHRAAVSWLCAVPLWSTFFFLVSFAVALLMAPFTREGLHLTVLSRDLLLASGWSAGMTLLARVQPAHINSPQGAAEHLTAVAWGGSWGLTLAGAILLVGHPGETTMGSHGAVFSLLAPWILLVSLVPFLLPQRIQRYSATRAASRGVQQHAEARPRFTRLPGLARVLLDDVLTAALFTLLAAGMTLPVTLLWPAGPVAMMARLPDLRFFLLLMPLMLMLKWLPSLGALRVLPIARNHLALGLVLFPLVLGLGALAGMLLLLWIPSFTFDFDYLLPMAIFAWGLITIALAASLRYGGWAIYVTMWIAIVSPTWGRGLPMLGILTVPIGTVLILAGTAAIGHLLAHHGALYHRRYNFMTPRGARTR
jgi:hypothetical protein